MAQVKHPFIVVEGIDAAGSSTQTDLLVKKLIQVGYKPLSLHFPQLDIKTGQLIYNKFLRTKKMGTLSGREQALLYIADFYSRADDISAVMRGVSDCDVVVADRWCTSTFAYQTVKFISNKAKREQMMEWLTWLCYQGQPTLPKPDLVLFLDTTADTAQKRLRSRKKDYFEDSIDKQRAIRASYKYVSEHKSHSRSWRVIKHDTKEGGERTREDLHQEIWDVVQKKFKL